jgi:hypothetical protein
MQVLGQLFRRNMHEAILQAARRHKAEQRNSILKWAVLIFKLLKLAP